MIFYADDDADDLAFFSDIATSLGRKVLTFDWGDDLLHQLRNPPPTAGIVFLDINMPRISGLQILEQIRKSVSWKNLPVVMLTTSNNEDNIEQCRQLGANYYIPKSPNYDKLKASVEFVLKIDWKRHRVERDGFVYSH